MAKLLLQYIQLLCYHVLATAVILSGRIRPRCSSVCAPVLSHAASVEPPKTHPPGLWLAAKWSVCLLGTSRWSGRVVKCVSFHHSTSRLSDCRLMLPGLADAGVPFPAAGCGGLAPVPLIFVLAFGLAGACRFFGRLGARWPYPLP